MPAISAHQRPCKRDGASSAARSDCGIPLEASWAADRALAASNSLQGTALTNDRSFKLHMLKSDRSDFGSEMINWDELRQRFALQESRDLQRMQTFTDQGPIKNHPVQSNANILLGSKMI